MADVRRLQQRRDRGGIPVTNTSVNPARSTGPALFVGGWALAQLWLFWVAPLIGGVLGGVIYRWLSEEPAGVARAARRRNKAGGYFSGGDSGDTRVSCPILRPGRGGPLP